MAMILLFCLPFTLIIVSLINKVTSGYFTIKWEIDENLKNYFETIDADDRQWSILEEENIRKNYAMKTLTDETLDRFKKTKQKAEEPIQGVHCYDILANPDYAAAFQYVPSDVPHRSLMIQDDDEDESNDII